MGVRENYSIVLAILVMFSITTAVAAEAPTGARVVDDVARRELGVGVVGLSLMLRGGDMVFFHADSLTDSEREGMRELREAKLATIREVSSNGVDYIQVVPTSEGDEVRRQLLRD